MTVPGGDRTGPWNHGPRTGRAMGFCSGFSRPGYANPGGFGGGRFFGRGFGRGRGRGLGRGYGRGFRAAYWPPYEDEPIAHMEPPVWSSPSPSDEKSYLEDVRKSLEQEMEAIKKRLEELSGKTEE